MGIVHIVNCPAFDAGRRTGIVGIAMRLDGVEIKISFSREQTAEAVAQLDLPFRPDSWQAAVLRFLRSLGLDVPDEQEPKTRQVVEHLVRASTAAG